MITRRSFLELLPAAAVLTGLDVEFGTPAKKFKPPNNEFNQTFENFLVGQSNDFAHAVSRKFAEGQFSTYSNPVYICGPVGIGKTHLLRAIAHRAKALDPSLKVQMLTGEAFLSRYIQSIRHGTLQEFRRRYRDEADLLLIDGLDFIARGEATQDEFLHTISRDYDRPHRIAIVGDSRPWEINGLKPQILDRIEDGVVARIREPDKVLKAEFVRHEAKKRDIALSGEQVRLIAQSGLSFRGIQGELLRRRLVPL